MSDQHKVDLDDLFDKTFLSEIDIEKYVDGQSASYEDQMKVKQKFFSDYNITKNFPQHIDCITSYDEFNTRKLYTIEKQFDTKSNTNSVQNPPNSNMMTEYKSELSLDTTVHHYQPLRHENNHTSNDNVYIPKSTYAQLRYSQIPNEPITKSHLDNTIPRNQSIKTPLHHEQQQQQQQQYIQQQDLHYKFQLSTHHQNNIYPSNLPYHLYPVVPSGQSFRPSQSLQSTKITQQTANFQQPFHQSSSTSQNFYANDLSQLISQSQLEQGIENNYQKTEVNSYEPNIQASDPKVNSSTTIEHLNTEIDSDVAKRPSSSIKSLSKSICGLDLTVSKIHLSDFTLLNNESREIKMEFLASLDGKFYANNKYMMVDDDNDDDHKSFPIACYRRNFSTILISLYFSDTPKYLEVNGSYYEINNTRLSLDAKSNFSQSPIELAYFENPNTEKQSCNVVLMNDAILDLGTFKDRKNVKMQRFQFKKATPNNGKNIAKDYYYLFVTLSFDLVENNPSELNKRKLPFHQKIITLKTNSISVRGRNPSFYTERNDESINRDTSVCYKYFNGFVEDS